MQSRSKGNAQGIDVSHWQGIIDWKKVALSGISFVFIKATQNGMDKKFLDNVKGAKAAGLLVGAYHYIDDSVTTVDKARSAARIFHNAIQAAGGQDMIDLPPVMDYESNKNNLSKPLITAIAKAFLEEIQRLAGAKPLIYTYPAFIGNFVGLSDYPLWIARYSTQTPSDAAGWTSWDFWQYSDGTAGGMLHSGNRKVNGINGPVDLNEYNGTVAELKSRYNKKIEPVRDVELVPDSNKDINVASPWADENWVVAKANGYFDGTRPGAPITREETAIVINRMRLNFLKLIGGNTAGINALDDRLKKIEKES